MPDQPLWYSRVTEILVTLEDSEVLLLDRFAVEKLFRVSRRTAIRVMNSFGGYQVGRTFVIPRQEILRQLSKIAQDGTPEIAAGRKQRVWRILEQERAHVRARAVAIPLPAQPALLPEIGSLPVGVRLERGLLTVRFGAPVELLQKLFVLSQALAQDFEAFERRCGTPE